MGDLSLRIYSLMEEMQSRLYSIYGNIDDKYTEFSANIRSRIPSEETFIQSILSSKDSSILDADSARNLYYETYVEEIDKIQQEVDRLYKKNEKEKERVSIPILTAYEKIINDMIKGSGIFVNPLVIHFEFFGDASKSSLIGEYIRSRNKKGIYIPGGIINFYNLSLLTPQLIEHELTHAADFDRNKRQQPEHFRQKESIFTNQDHLRFVKRYYNNISELRSRSREIILSLRQQHDAEEIHGLEFRKNLVQHIQATDTWLDMVKYLNPQSRRVVYELVYNNLYN